MLAILLIRKGVSLMTKNKNQFLEALEGVPDFWKFTPVQVKRPVLSNWQEQFLTLEEAIEKGLENPSYPLTGIGLLLGEQTQTVALDFDHPNAYENFKKLFGHDVDDLPPTIGWSSGRPGRKQLAFLVPKSWWSKVRHIEDHKDFMGAELRWNKHQSVITGVHPNDKNGDQQVPRGKGDGQGFYSWLPNCSPREQQLAVAPDWFLVRWQELCQKKSSAPIRTRGKEDLINDSSRVDECLSKYLQPANDLSNYATWLKVGMALHHLSQEHGDQWKHYQDWLNWSSQMDNFDEEECLNKWQSFGSSDNPYTFATIVYLAKKHPDYNRSKPQEEEQTSKGGKTAKPSDDCLEAARDAVDLIKKQWERIKTLDKPAERTAALELVQKDAGLSPKGFRNVVEDLVAESNTDDIKYPTYDALMSAKDLTPEPLVEGFLARGNVVILAAEGGTGKSTFCYELAEAISSGNDLFGQLKTVKDNVKIIQCDESPQDARIKLDMMNVEPTKSNLSFKWDFKPSMIFDLEKEVERDKIGLCIMDSFVKIFGTGNDMNTPEVGLYLYELNKMASRTGTTVLIPHHLKKDQNQRKKKKKDDPDIFRTEVTQDDLYGNVFIFNGASDVWGLWVSGEEFGQNIYRLKNLKNRSMIAPSDHVYQLQGNEETLRFEMRVKTDGDIDDADTIKKAVLILLEKHIGEKFSINQICEKIPKCRGMNNGKAYLGKVMGRLYLDKSNTGIERTKSPDKTGGRHSYVYYKR